MIIMKKLGVLFAAVLMMVSFSILKAQKLAQADISAILQAMPEMKAAQDQLNTLSNTKQAALQAQQKALEDKAKKYNDEANKQTQQVNQQRETELQQDQQKLQQMVQMAQQDVQKKQDELFAPIDAKLKTAVDAVAKAKGYEYVFDVNGPSLIYKGGPDITNDIKAQLGIK